MSRRRTKRSDKQDDVLSLSDSDDSSDSSFSGFSKVNSPRRTSLRSVVNVVGHDSNPVLPGDKDRVTPNPKSHDNNRNGGEHAGSSNLVDLNNLTPESIENLKTVLGLQKQTPDIPKSDGMSFFSDTELVYDDDDNYHDNRPQIAGGMISNNFETSLFDGIDESHNSDDDDTWPQAKLKVPDRGDPISDSLAKLINDSCTQMCSVNDTVAKYKVPSNCDYLLAPKVNEEIWGDLARQRRVQTTDRLLRDTQNLLTAGMVPVLSMAKVLRPHIGKMPEVKTLIADSLTLLGQVQYNLSLRRRYLLRPFLKQKYSGICNANTPITTFLFGDDVSKELKKCETSIRVGKFSTLKSTSLGPIRGRRGRWRSRGTPYGRGGYGSSRQPPSSYGQFGYKHDFARQQKKPAKSNGNPKLNASQTKVTKTQGSFDTPAQWKPTSNGKDASADWCSRIGQTLQDHGVPELAINTVFKSWSHGTRKQYTGAWKRWYMWCGLRFCDPIRPLEIDIIAYLTYLKQINKSFSVISSHKSVILETVKILNTGLPFDINILNRFMKGLHRDLPPKPRYSSTWSVNNVLDLISTWMPLESLCLKMLTYKLVSLVALCTAARAQTLKSLNVDQLHMEEDCVFFDCGDKLKSSKPGQNFVLKLKAYDKASLCPIQTLKHYLKCTGKFRKDKQLFVSFKSYKAVSTSTLARWLKDVLLLAGIDTKVFKAHSFRGASSSAAAKAGCKMSDILKTANWSSSKNFYKFYYRDIQSSSSKNSFQDYVLGHQ